MRIKREVVEQGKFLELIKRPVKTGVYLIECNRNNKCYIGESFDIDRRWKQHVEALNNNAHHSKKLQADWNIFCPDDFAFEIIELYDCEATSQKRTTIASLLIRERVWQNRFNAINEGYNGIDSVDKILKSKSRSYIDKDYLRWFDDTHTFETTLPKGAGINAAYITKDDKMRYIKIT